MLPNKRTVAIIAITTIVGIVVIVLVSIPRDTSEFYETPSTENYFNESSCTTPAKEIGVCVAQSSCATDSPSTEVAQSVQLSQCDSTTNIIYVCCVLRNHISDQDTTQITPTTELWNIEPNIHASIPKSDEDIQYGMAILQESECGEDDARLSESPWMALLVYESTYKGTPPHCSGSLITNRYVLTVAHCIYDLYDKLVSVRLGGNTGCLGSECVQSPFQEINVEEAIYHRKYTRHYLNDDIGLIRLIKQAKIDFYVRPICLPMTSESQTITLDEAELAAWSAPAFDIDIRVGVVLKKAKVQIKDNDYCQQIFRIIQITEKQVCAIGTLDGFEFGVSGGPLYISVNNGQYNPKVQYGILTGGEKSESGVVTKSRYSKIIAYLTWIAGNIHP